VGWRGNETACRSQWPRGLRHELSSPTRRLWSRVRIPLEPWMSVCVYSVYVVLCVGSGLATCWSLVQGVLPTVYMIKKLKSGQDPTKGCTAIDRWITDHLVLKSERYKIAFSCKFSYKKNYDRPMFVPSLIYPRIYPITCSQHFAILLSRRNKYTTDAADLRPQVRRV
jgi:hypothetical protein